MVGVLSSSKNVYSLNNNVLLLFFDYVVNRMILFKCHFFLFEHPVMDYSHMKNCVLRTGGFYFWMTTLHLSTSTGRQSVRLCVVCCCVCNDNRYLQSKSDAGHDIVAGVLMGVVMV